MKFSDKRISRRAAGLTTALALALSLSCGGASSFDHPGDMPHKDNADIDWRDQVIYQIMVDRFDNGDPNNDYNVEPTVPSRYHGGDWQGIIDRLDYLEELGVTALWISPVVRNTEEDAGFSSYHGYWTQDFLRTNPHFGDLMKLRELVDAAHERDMLVILDIVTNHVGQLFFYDINGNGRPDDWLAGGGTSHTCVQKCQADPCSCYAPADPRWNAAECSEQVDCVCSADENLYCYYGSEYLERIIEWDPEYDPRGIQGWSSLGFSGPANIEFLDWPDGNRVLPPRPSGQINWPDDWGWFDEPEWYNRRGRVYTWWHEGDGYSRTFLRDQETLGDFPGGLKDLDTDHPEVQQALIRSFRYWIDVADFDGFRIDTVKHIDRPDTQPDVRGFWGAFTTAMREHAASIGKQNFFMFGEAFDGNDELIGAYTFPGVDPGGPFQRLDSVFYFSQYYRVIDAVFKRGGATKNIECMYRSRMGTAGDEPWCGANGYAAGPTYYDQPHASREEGGIGLAPQQALVNFLDNHDLPRFLFQQAEDQPDPFNPEPLPDEVLYSALFYLLTWDGIPCIYYGTEQLFEGGVDPKNREDMFLGNPHRGFPPFDTENEAFIYVRDLVAMRKQHIALRRGDVQIRWATAEPRGVVDSGIVAYERVHADETVLVVLNTADDQTSRTCAADNTCMTTSFSPGDVLRDIAPGNDGATFTVAADGTIDVSVPARTGRVLVR